MSANMVAVFDTLQYAKRLKEVGFTERQAEVQAEAIAEIIDDKLATKQDVSDLGRELRQELMEFRIEFKNDLKELEYKLTIKMGSFLVIGITVLVTLMKLFHL